MRGPPSRKCAPRSSAGGGSPSDSQLLSLWGLKTTATASQLGTARPYSGRWCRSSRSPLTDRTCLVASRQASTVLYGHFIGFEDGCEIFRPAKYFHTKDSPSGVTNPTYNHSPVGPAADWKSVKGCSVPRMMVRAAATATVVSREIVRTRRSAYSRRSLLYAADILNFAR
jgi:hypothetical protein